MALATRAKPKLMTAEEFYDWANLPKNRDRHFELENGRVVEVSLPGERHCAVCGNVTRILGNYTFRRKKGYVCPNDMGLIVTRDPDTVRGADVALYNKARRYEELEIKYRDKPPELSVDVLSPNDSMGKMMRRVKQFLRRGVKLVWIVDPEAHNVTVCRPNQEPFVVEADEIITGLDVLPDLRFRVSDSFDLPGE